MKYEECRNEQLKISKTAQELIDYAEEHPEYLKASNFSSIKWHEEKFVLQPWPTFINRELRDKFGAASRSVFKLIKSIPKRLFNNDPVKISKYFNIPVNDIKLSLTGLPSTQMDLLLGRGDFILTPDSVPKCIEYNIASNLGGGQLPFWTQLYLQHPLIAEFIRKKDAKLLNENLLTVLFEHIIESVLKSDTIRIKEGDSINSVIHLTGANPNGPYGSDPQNLNQLYKEVLERKYGNRYTGQVITSDFRHLDVKDQNLWYKDIPIHTFMEFDYVQGSPDLLTPYYSGQLLVFNGPISIITANKLNIALLSEHEDSKLFSPQEQELIRKHIPWTRKTVFGKSTYKGDSIVLEDFAINNREQLVLKPADGVGGYDLYCGRYCTPREWKKIIIRAFKDKKWVLQEYIEPMHLLYQSGDEGYEPHYSVYGVFVFGDRVAGNLSRVQPIEQTIGAINAAQGAKLSVVLELDE